MVHAAGEWDVHNQFNGTEKPLGVLLVDSLHFVSFAEVRRHAMNRNRRHRHVRRANLPEAVAVAVEVSDTANTITSTRTDR